MGLSPFGQLISFFFTFEGQCWVVCDDGEDTNVYIPQSGSWGIRRSVGIISHFIFVCRLIHLKRPLDLNTSTDHWWAEDYEISNQCKNPYILALLAADLTYGEVSDNCCVANGYLKNRPLPSSKDPHFQNEAKCTTFLVKMSFICMRMKYHFISKAVHLTSFWYRGPGELGNGPFVLKTRLIFVRKARIVSQM